MVIRAIHGTGLPRCDAISLGDLFSTFRNVVVPSSSRSRVQDMLVA